MTKTDELESASSDSLSTCHSVDLRVGIAVVVLAALVLLITQLLS